MPRPGNEPWPPRLGDEHSSKQLFEQRINSYSEHLHMSLGFGCTNLRFDRQFSKGALGSLFEFQVRRLNEKSVWSGLYGIWLWDFPDVGEGENRAVRQCLISTCFVHLCMYLEFVSGLFLRHLIINILLLSMRLFLNGDLFHCSPVHKFFVP